MSSRPRYRRVDSVLRSGALARLESDARRIGECQRELRALLGSPLGDHASVGAVDGDTLVVIADSAAWASRLRFVPHEVLETLRGRLGWPRFERIRVIVRPPRGEPPRETPAPAILTERARATIREAAEATDNEALREILERLARVHRP